MINMAYHLTRAFARGSPIGTPARFVRFSLLAAVLLALGACGGKPLPSDKWQEPPGETMEGSGLFTGEEGEWIIYKE